MRIRAVGALTLLPAGDQVPEEVDRNGVVGGQVRLVVDGKEAEALPLRRELGVELLRRHTHLLRELLVRERVGIVFHLVEKFKDIEKVIKAPIENNKNTEE